jgi:hypothetical protein
VTLSEFSGNITEKSGTFFVAGVKYANRGCVLFCNKLQQIFKLPPEKSTPFPTSFKLFAAEKV